LQALNKLEPKMKMKPKLSPRMAANGKLMSLWS